MKKRINFQKICYYYKIDNQWIISFDWLSELSYYMDDVEFYNFNYNQENMESLELIAQDTSTICNNLAEFFSTISNKK